MAVYLGFAAALEADDVDAARALAAASEHDMAKVLRAYLLACIDDNPTAAAAELAAVQERLDWKGILRFRAFAMARIHAADGYPEEAQRRLEDLAISILRAPTPEPFWERVLARARSAEPPAHARQKRGSGAQAPLQQGPWGRRA